MSRELAELSLIEVADRIARRDVSAAEVTRNAIARIERLEPTLNAFISFEPEAALAKAERVDAAIGRGETVGPLAGVPLAHKDMYYRAGKVTTSGSKISKGFVADHNSTALARLQAAGALYLGGLNMSEFVTGPTGHNLHYGDCHNPWNPDHAPGGSSSGSGAATAARLVYGAMGSDTGGSIRIPAGMCGVVGLKPTQTRVTRYGVTPLCFSFDCCGPLTRTVRDAARMLGVIAGHDPNDPTSSRRPVDDYEAACGREARGLRIGVPTSHYNDDLDPAVAAMMDASRKTFTNLGCELVEVDMPDHDTINTLWNVILSSEAATIHRRWLRDRRDDYAPQVRRRLEVGLFQPATRYIEALTLRAGIAQAFVDEVFGACDVLHIPTMPMPAPRLDDIAVGDDDDMPAVILRVSGMTRPINFLGLPSLSLPGGFSETGLPACFQLVGRPFAEATLCRLGDAFQQATDWHTRLPALADF